MRSTIYTSWAKSKGGEGKYLRENEGKRQAGGSRGLINSLQGGISRVRAGGSGGAAVLCRGPMQR